MDGFELTASIRSDPSLRTLPVIVFNEKLVADSTAAVAALPLLGFDDEVLFSAN